MTPGERWQVTDDGYAMRCPECGELAEGTVSIGIGKRFFCSCGNRWATDEIDGCLECGKPLGGTDVVCYSCRQEGSV